jgi:hypothetical protein
LSSSPDETDKAFGDSQGLFCFGAKQARLQKRQNKKARRTIVRKGFECFRPPTLRIAAGNLVFLTKK